MISSCTHFVSWCFSQNDFINEEEMYNQMTSSKEGANIYYRWFKCLSCHSKTGTENIFREIVVLYWFKVAMKYNFVFV